MEVVHGSRRVVCDILSTVEEQAPSGTLPLQVNFFLTDTMRMSVQNLGRHRRGQDPKPSAKPSGRGEFRGHKKLTRLRKFQILSGPRMLTLVRKGPKVWIFYCRDIYYLL